VEHTLAANCQVQADAVTGLAVGWLGDPESLPEKLREREMAPRGRKSLDTMAFGGWGEV